MLVQLKRDTNNLPFEQFDKTFDTSLVSSQQKKSLGKYGLARIQRGANGRELIYRPLVIPVSPVKKSNNRSGIDQITRHWP
jgi:hypothetical protein